MFNFFRKRKQDEVRPTPPPATMSEQMLLNKLLNGIHGFETFSPKEKKEGEYHIYLNIEVNNESITAANLINTAKYSPAGTVVQYKLDQVALIIGLSAMAQRRETLGARLEPVDGKIKLFIYPRLSKTVYDKYGKALRDYQGMHYHIEYNIKRSELVKIRDTRRAKLDEVLERSIKEYDGI